MSISRRSLVVGAAAAAAAATAPAWAISPSLIPLLFAGGTRQGAMGLLGNEQQGLAADFTGGDGLGSVAVRDRTTPANNQNNVQVNPYFTQSNASVKWVLGPNGIWVQKAAGLVAIGMTPAGYRGIFEGVATNLALQSDDFTSASWTKSNMSTAKTATGADGAANSATTLTATAGNATALQAITSGSSARVTSCAIKRRTGTGNIDLTQDNGSTWATQAVTAAWQRFSITPVTSANPTVGVRIVTNGDAVDVMWFQHETGSLVTSPVPTTTVTATRGKDTVFRASSPYPTAAEMSVLVIGTAYSLGAGGFISLNNGASSERADIRVTGTDIITDSGATQANMNNGIGAINTRYKMALRMRVNDFAAFNNGVSTATDLAGAVATGLNRIDVGILDPGGASAMNGEIESVVVLPRGKSDAELAAWTL